jgi:hypothetical protein
VVYGCGFSWMIRLADGRAFSSPSKAAAEAAGLASFDGWYVWTVTRLEKTLNDLRKDLVARVSAQT